MVVIRRFLLTGLGSPAVTAVAVALTGNTALPSSPLIAIALTPIASRGGDAAPRNARRARRVGA